jgi:hypothetical protein
MNKREMKKQAKKLNISFEQYLEILKKKAMEKIDNILQIKKI